MLNVRALPLLMFLLSSTAQGHTIEIGVFPVYGACVMSDYRNRGNMPWQTQKPNLVLGDGQQRFSVLVLPSKLDDAQLPVERNALERCVIMAGRALSPEDRANANREVEENLAKRVNVCLVDARVSLEVRFAAVKNGQIECPDGATQR